ncbi:MAG: DUF2279 domain-containing protein [Flavobacteriaceae bacterium]|nr:DUF2279 domain-containing protein [Flavobacteriaceae bacterium]
MTYVFLLIFVIQSGFAQLEDKNFWKPSDSLNKARRNAVAITGTGLAAASLIALNALWYDDFERSSFHTLDDTNEWFQMDKYGHVFSSYQLGRLGAESLNWSGVQKKDQRIYGAGMGLAFLTTVEIFDGFSEEWGFSWSDFGANVLGTGIYVGQELLWNEQRMSIKYSFHRTKYAPMRPDKLGENLLQEMFKDYNGQTYWLSINLDSFFKEANLPEWLNFAVGIGADGMLTGINETNNEFGLQDRYRQFYLSLDIDLSRIETKSHFLKTVFSVVNVLKIPFPTLELNVNKKSVFHLFYH